MSTIDPQAQDILDRYSPEVVDRATRLHASGYRCISRRLRLATRLDRPDWRDHMARESTRDLAEGRRWVDILGPRAADHYRRCYSHDRIGPLSDEVMKVLRTITSTSKDADEYREKIGLA